MKHDLMAAACTAVVEFEPGCLPLDGFTGVHDPLHVRILIMESNVRMAIVSVEITSLFDETLDLMRKTVCDCTGIAPENVWITLTHSFAGPHIWPSPKPGEEDTTRPGHKSRTPEEIRRCAKLRDAYVSALRNAAQTARNRMCEAVVGSGKGLCKVNASRNILTPEGWWLGTDSEEFCDHSLPVLRIDSIDGTPIAVLFVYGVRSCVTTGIRDSGGNLLISSDLCGAACQALECEFGGDFTAMFLCGAAGDQDPQLKGSFDTLDRSGSLRHVDLGLAAYCLQEAQGLRLAAEVLKVYRNIGTLSDISEIRLKSHAFTCQTKKMNRNLKSLRPQKRCDLLPEGEKELVVHAAQIGNFYLIGVQPEINGITAVSITEALSGKTCAVAIMVNGCDKCMPETDNYVKCKFQSQNSPFMPGSAEKLQSIAVKLLMSLEEG